MASVAMSSVCCLTGQACGPADHDRCEASLGCRPSATSCSAKCASAPYETTTGTAGLIHVPWNVTGERA